MDVNAWMQKALEEIEKLPFSKKFEAKELFNGCEWDALSKGDRIKFGKFFKGEVLEERVPNVVFLDRGKNNHSKYEKVEDSK